MHRSGCQRPVEQVESWCFNGVQAGRQAEKTHSPHGQMGCAQHLTAGGACMGWCQWGMRHGRGRRCTQSKHKAVQQNFATFLLDYDFLSLNNGQDNTHFSNVMTCLWPVYCHARRRARSLASELKFKRARVTLSYSVTTKHTGEAMDITSTSATVWCFTSHNEDKSGDTYPLVE